MITGKKLYTLLEENVDSSTPPNLQFGGEEFIGASNSHVSIYTPQGKKATYDGVDVLRKVEMVAKGITPKNLGITLIDRVIRTNTTLQLDDLVLDASEIGVRYKLRELEIQRLLREHDTKGRFPKLIFDPYTGNDAQYFLIDSDLCLQTLITRMPGKTMETKKKKYHNERETTVEMTNPVDIVKMGYDLAQDIELFRYMGIIHRDIKRANTLREGKKNGEPSDFRIIDFGVATSFADIYLPCEKAGTEGFMAPEIMRGEGANLTSDIFSLGVLLYAEINRNKLPFGNQGKADVDETDIEIITDRAKSTLPFNHRFIEAITGMMHPLPHKREDAFKDYITIAENILDAEVPHKAMIQQRNMKNKSFNRTNASPQRQTIMDLRLEEVEKHTKGK